jgi:hypothetical protein
VANTYDASTSTDFTQVQDAELRPQEYGTTYTEGIEVKDTVCPVNEAESCVFFDWFMILYQTGMDEIDGILGMSSGLAEESGPLFVKKLYEEGLVTEPVFGWFLTGMTGESYIDLGYLAEESIREGEELVWMPVVDNDFWWTNTITGVKFDGFEYFVRE